MKKCKSKKTYNNGGTLSSVLPMIPSMLSMVNPLFGTASGVALNMLQNSKQNNSNNNVVNSNPYGFELGGQLPNIDPPKKKKKTKAEIALETSVKDNLGEFATAGSKLKNIQADVYSSMGKSSKALAARKAAGTLKVLGPVVSAIDVGLNLKDENYIRAGFSSVPFLPNVLDYATNNTWDSKEANSTIKQAFSSIPELINTYKEHVKSHFKLGGKLIGNDTAPMYQGNSHTQGGIKVNTQGVPMSNSDQEVEGDEVVIDMKGTKYVFSKKLTV